jgi:hypothetical protein
MKSEPKLRRILVVISVIAYTIAAMGNVVFAFSPTIDAKHAAAAAFVMVIGIGVTLFSRKEEDFMGGPLFKGQPVLLGFAAGLWANVVLAFAGGLYPILGIGHFIPFMGYAGSIAFIPPILVRVIMPVLNRMGKGSRK